MTVIDCEVIKARDPQTDELVEAVVIPEGYVCCLMLRENAERFSGWTECAALRVEVDEDDMIATLEVSDDLDGLTSPEAGA